MTNYKQVKAFTSKQNFTIFIAALCSLIVAIIVVTISINACDTTERKKQSFQQVSHTMEKSDSASVMTSIEEAEPAEQIQEFEWAPNSHDVELIAKTLYGECRGVQSQTEKAAVAWCILNRVDTKGYACGHSVEYVVTFKNQFQGYDEDHPVTQELKKLAEDVLIRHHKEQEGETDVGRVLPKEYIYFVGDTIRNYFTTEFLGKDYWEWSLESPYED